MIKQTTINSLEEFIEEIHTAHYGNKLFSDDALAHIFDHYTKSENSLGMPWSFEAVLNEVNGYWREYTLTKLGPVVRNCPLFSEYKRLKYGRVLVKFEV